MNKVKDKNPLAFELDPPEEKDMDTKAEKEVQGKETVPEEVPDKKADGVDPEKPSTDLVSKESVTLPSINTAKFEALGISGEFAQDLMALPEEEREEILEELEEDLMGNLANEEPDFPKIQILHSAAIFELPDGTKPDTFEATIIEILPARAWWEKAMSKENLPPDCHSADWLTPDADAPNKQASSCVQCPHNVWGTSVDATGEPTRGKACRMRKRIFLHLPDHEIPFLLSAPPKSLKAVREYLVKLSDQKIQKNRILTTFGLDPQTEGAQQFSILTFVAGRQLGLQEYRATRKKREAYINKMVAVKSAVEEFVGEGEDPVVPPDDRDPESLPKSTDSDMPF